ncbi:MAG: hypothetical protein QM784_12815 [Polyangiaceae bacterium]
MTDLRLGLALLGSLLLHLVVVAGVCSRTGLQRTSLADLPVTAISAAGSFGAGQSLDGLSGAHAPTH